MMTKLTIAGFVCLIGLTTAFAGGLGLEGTFLQTAASLAIATTQTAGDCNGNGIADDEDIASGTSKDCNQNGVPDECDFIADLTATGSAGYSSLTGFHGQASFFYVYPPNGNDRYVGDVSTTEYALKDIAVDPTDNKIYTISTPGAGKGVDISQHLYLVDPVTGAGTQLPQATSTSSLFDVLGLTFGPDGTLYGIGEAGFVILDKTTGAMSQVVNAGVFGFGMATSLTGQIYSVRNQLIDPNQPVLTSNAGVLQLHDAATGAVTSSVDLTGPQSAERQIVDIAFGADGKLYGIKGYVFADPPSYIAFEGIGLVIIDPATGAWTDVGSVFDNLVGLGGPRAKASLDCNKNGIPDECETDCNHNKIPDDCDIASGTSKDCNGNGIPDECDIASGASVDCNSNGVPDECDIVRATSVDCNGNSIPDECDVLSGAGTDANGDGVLDECQTPQGQDTPPPTGPLCIFFLFQSLFGIPLCGPCLVASMFVTLVGLGGMKVYVRRRVRRGGDRSQH
jgi:hypothetical protein